MRTNTSFHKTIAIFDNMFDNWQQSSITFSITSINRTFSITTTTFSITDNKRGTTKNPSDLASSFSQFRLIWRRLQQQHQLASGLTEIFDMISNITIIADNDCMILGTATNKILLKNNSDTKNNFRSSKWRISRNFWKENTSNLSRKDERHFAWEKSN